jgi:hypothetical protein
MGKYFFVYLKIFKGSQTIYERRIICNSGSGMPLFDKFKRKKSNALSDNSNQGNRKTGKGPPEISDSKGASDRIIRNNFSQFAERALKGPADCKIKIAQINELIGQLTQGLELKGASYLEIVKLIEANLLGVCPKCATQSRGGGLHMLGTLPTITTNLFCGGTTGGFERLLQGYCRNEKCWCSDMLVFWSPDGYLQKGADIDKIIRN